MTSYASHSDDFRYEPMIAPNPEHIRRVVEKIVWDARASHAALYLLIDVLGERTYELHENDLQILRRTHE